jgi:hypothetical protein
VSPFTVAQGGPFSSLGDAAHQDEHAGALSLTGVFVSLCPQDEFALSLPLPRLCVPDAQAPAVSAFGQELAVGGAAHAGWPSS